MKAYAVAVIKETRFGDEVKEYLRRIDSTLEPYEGKYLIHGGSYDVLEGGWDADVVLLEFPSMDQARAWYESPAYRAIRSLRIRNTEGPVILVQGVRDGHRGSDLLGQDVSQPL